VFLGATAGGYPPVPPLPVLIAKSCLVGGMTLRQVEDVPGGEADRTIADAVRSGRWRVPVGEVVPLERVAELHRRLEARELRGRAVIEVGGENVGS
jgi:NADPH:quinone reductase-like Zn-dependent oxidoreductase